MAANTSLLKKRDSYLYNLRNIAVHFLGDRMSEPLRRRVDQRIDTRLAEVMADQPKGKLIPVDRRKDLSAKEFKQKYARKKPVIFEGAAQDWPCSQNWSQARFAQRFGDDEVLLFNPVKNVEGQLEYSFSNLGEAIHRMQTDREINVRFSPILVEHPELQADLNLDWFKARISAALPNSKQYQMFIGGYDSSTHIHTAISDNLFLQVEGQKRWIIFHPKYHPVFKPHIDRTPYFISDLDYENPNSDKYPYLDKTSGYECVLNPGDILYNPCFYWHYVTSISPSVSLGYRWIDPVSVWNLDPTLGFLTFCSFNPPIWKISKNKDYFTKILTDKSNSRASEKQKV